MTVGYILLVGVTLGAGCWVCNAPETFSNHSYDRMVASETAPPGDRSVFVSLVAWSASDSERAQPQEPVCFLERYQA